MINLNDTSKNTSQLEWIMAIFRNAGVIRVQSGHPVIIKLKGKPDLTTKPLYPRVKEVFRSQRSPPATPVRRTRKARKHVRNRPTLEPQNGIEDYRESQDKTRNLHLIETEGCVNDTLKEGEDPMDLFEYRRIDTSNLRRFAQEKLPSSSILRGVLIAESEELTVEEFLAKMDIWCLLFRKDIGE